MGRADQGGGHRPWIFREAFRIARSGRPGPVLIDIPVDVAKGIIEYDPALDSPLPVAAVEPHRPRVEKALDLLLAAERPLILAGGGVIIAEAADELRELAEYLNVPVQVTLMGKGAIDEDHGLFCGITGVQTSQRYGNASFLESDLVLAVGARFGDRHTGQLDVYRGERKFIHVDIEPTQIGRVFEPDLGVVSDAKLFLQDLLKVAKEREAGRGPGAWVGRIQHLKATLGRREDFDTVPIKAPGSTRRSTRSSTRTPTSSPRSASTRSGAASTRRRTSRAATRSAARPARWAGRSRRRSASRRRSRTPSRTPRSWASSATTASSTWWRSSRSAPSTTCRSCSS
nr:hypothetical protein GCM10020093_113580 [Planobispora longispora]